MNNSTKTTIQFIIFLLFFSHFSFGQVCINNPSIQQGNLSSTSGSGTMSFSFVENLLDYTDEENDPITITICLLNMVPTNGTVDDSTPNYFSWAYDPISNCFQGTQINDIFGGTGGVILIDYSINFSGSCTPFTFGFNANLQPAACMNGINETVDDTESVYLSGFGSGVTATPTSCIATNGSATVQGTGPFNVLWSTGETTQSIAGLAPGSYSATVSDDINNCPFVENFQIKVDNSLCVQEVRGNVTIDHITPDCTVDPTSYPLVGRTVSLYKNNILIDVSITNALGDYTLAADSGTYTVILDADPTDILNCGVQYQQTVLVDTVAVYADYILDVTPHQDLCVFHAPGRARPGFVQHHMITYCNYGTGPMTGSVEFVHDLRTHSLLPSNQSPAPNSYDPVTGKAIWNFSNLQPNQCEILYFKVTVHQPPTVNIDDTLHYQTSILPSSTDIDIENNFMNTSEIVVGSYDPNDKQNLVGESTWGGPVFPDDDVFKYFIRFQNTGTDTAFNVRIEDVIDPNLDISTIRPVASSHTYDLSLKTDTLVFSFNNILLVDSVANEPASHGFVSFTIDLLPGLPLGTVIDNQAAIFFDFNLPVITNIVTNTIIDFQTGLNTNELEGTVHAFPNPTNGDINLEMNLTNSDELSVDLTDVNGKVLKQFTVNQSFTSGEHLLELSVDELPTGMYFIRVSGNQGAKVLKLLRY